MLHFMHVTQYPGAYYLSNSCRQTTGKYIGYVMPFCIEPPRYSRPNQASSLANAEFFTQALNTLLADCQVRYVDVQPPVCIALSVVVSSAQKREIGGKSEIF